uniref:Uncharacterized protein n=1 Tax=Panagrellus redivivus TaxID=6233 RepID=A0A7E4VV10_PANRE
MAYKIAITILFIASFALIGSADDVVLGQWPQGSYCIFMGSAGDCPTGFVKRSIRLSVPQNYSPSDKFRDGENIITVGDMGASKLQAMAYEDVYVMDLKTCCKEW